MGYNNRLYHSEENTFSRDVVLGKFSVCRSLVYFSYSFDVITFHWRWVGGNGTCKLVGFLVEATYTVSITTLVVLSFQRLKVIVDPLNARIGSWPRKKFLKIVTIWAIGLAVWSPLAHIYRVEKQDTGKLVCANTKWGNIGQKIFYTLHSSLFFIAPLLYMIITQTQIRRVLRSRVQTINNTLMEREFNRRHKKVATTLVALTINYSVCYLLVPFYGHTNTFVLSPSFIWLNLDRISTLSMPKRSSWILCYKGTSVETSKVHYEDSCGAITHNSNVLMWSLWLIFEQTRLANKEIYM